MPLYEYVCRTCDTDFEALVPGQPPGLPPTRPALKCSATKTARKISLMAQPVVKEGGRSGGASEPFHCGAPGGCCGGACATD